MAGWSRELSEVGGRNTLLWAPERRGGYLDLTTAHPSGVSMLLAGRRTALSDLVRETGAFEEALAVARRIHDATLALREERGLAAGFVAIGVAAWESPRARAVVEAPVLLRTCTLRPTSPGEHDFDVDLGAGVEVNPALVNYLSSVAGVAVDAGGLAALTEVASGFDPYPVYAALGRLCADVPGFEVSPRLVLGCYPNGKPAMVADIGAHSQLLAQVDVVAALAGDAGAAARLDTELPPVEAERDPEREVLVLPLDGAQESVLDAVRAGHQLVLQAPPGTGATQTIAALIASLAHDDKRSLYVTRHAESVRALQARLAGAGLGELLLDLTGAGEDRGPAARELSAALRRIAALDATALDDQAEPAGRVARATHTAIAAQALRDHVAAVHEVREPWGVTAYTVQERIAQLTALSPAPGSRVRLPASTLRELDHDAVAELAEQLQEAASAGAWSAEPGGDPWYGATISTDTDVARAREIVTELVDGGLADTSAHLDGILRESRLPAARSPRDWERACDTMRGVRRTLEVFRPEIFDVPLDEHLAATGSAEWRAGHDVDLGPVGRSRVRRQARRLLRPGRPPQDLHAELLAAAAQRQAWQQLVGAGGRPEISPRLDEADDAYAALADRLGWLGKRLTGTPDLLALSLPILRSTLTRLRATLHRLDVLPQVTPVIDALRAAAMGEVVDDFAGRAVPADQVVAELEHIWWASLAHEITARDLRYAGHDGPALRAAAERLAELDRDSRSSDAARVRAVVDRRARRRAREHPRQVDLLHGQAGLSHGHLPFADIFREAEQVLTAVRPCLAVSPYAVAQLLGPGRSFDVVIVDDASGITVAEGVSALGRAAHAIVVGDPGGPRPGAFRVGLAGALGGDAAYLLGSDPQTGPGAGASGGGESLLTAATRVLPRRTLTWSHAGADVRLGLPGWSGTTDGLPGPLEIPRVRLVSVDGTAGHLPASDAAIEWTDAEVQQVVDLVLDHTRRTPQRSLAVLTVTAALAQQVQARLRERLTLLPADHPALGLFTAPPAGAIEPFLVAPVERAQSVRRDVVILAVGYGRTPHGRVLHRFPSLAGPHAEADLARASGAGREELVVVSCLGADDLDPTRLRLPAAVRLRELLAHAGARGIPADGGEPEAMTPSDPPASALVRELADRLRREGLLVQEGFGAGKHRIDLAVGHRSRPGRWLVAVEDDGPRYAALPGVRGRDVQRADQVHRLGWRHLRVWSTDVYRDPARDVARVVAEVRAAVGEVAPPAASADPELELEHEGSDRNVSDPGSDAVIAEAEVEASADASADADADTDVDEDVDEDVDVGAASPPVEPADGPRPAARVRPEQTRDDTDAGWGELPDEHAHDRWLHEQRPPHWE